MDLSPRNTQMPGQQEPNQHIQQRCNATQEVAGKEKSRYSDRTDAKLRVLRVAIGKTNQHEHLIAVTTASLLQF